MGSTAAAVTTGLDPSIKDFWAWVIAEKERRPKMSYQKMVNAGAEQGVTLDRSSIVKAITNGSTPSREMIRLIAAAFDMSVDEVEVRAGLRSSVPRDVVDNRPLIVTVLANAQKMSNTELESIIALQRAMIDQKRRKLRSRSNMK